MDKMDKMDKMKVIVEDEATSFSLCSASSDQLIGVRRISLDLTHTWAAFAATIFIYQSI